ncbi:hypothetical protein EYF80_050157 [Liparis tanakae]|uniref:Uncharacterized protein n=1 Tax=Liparis tanakae TaxID=230148 RepID=A0A4Z2FFK8_9TELE|nr:hypothetical protein EYF80_050157 [Liparis tanakae]
MKPANWISEAAILDVPLERSYRQRPGVVKWMVKYGRHSVNPELCRTHEFHRPEYENTAVTGLSKRSCVDHWSIPVAAMIPATPNRLRRKPIT